MVHTTYVLRSQEQRIGRLAESGIKAAPQYLITLAGFLQPLLHVAKDFTGQSDAMRIILQRVGAQIEAVHYWIHVESRTKTRIFISVVSQLWFGSSRRNLSQL